MTTSHSFQARLECVALSRGKRHLIIVGDLHMLKQTARWSTVVQRVYENGIIFSKKDVEGFWNPLFHLVLSMTRKMKMINQQREKGATRRLIVRRRKKKKKRRKNNKRDISALIDDEADEADSDEEEEST